PATRGESFEYFKSTKGDQPVSELLDGTELSWKRVVGGEGIGKMIDSLVASFDLLHPERSVQGLVRLYRSISALPNGSWRTQKLKEVHTLIAQCSGLFLDATASEQFAVQTDSLRISFSFNNRLGTDAILQNVKVDAFDTTLIKPLEKNKNIGFVKTIYVAPGKPITQPYWLAKKMEEGYFNVTDQLAIGQPDVDPAYNAEVSVKIFGETFSFTRPVKYKFTDPVRGELYQPLTVLPPALIAPDNKIKISKGNNTFNGVLNITGKKKGFQTSLDGVGREQPDKVQVTYTPASITFDEKNKTIPVEYSIEANMDNDYYFAIDANNGRKDVYFVGMK
ncbi:MAG: PIG-L family deacetylase, partial [Chitinophagaceae bacterium]|nr:PIG-L family deacetylase [Chitinophagaceae bacterium]